MKVSEEQVTGFLKVTETSLQLSAYWSALLPLGKPYVNPAHDEPIEDYVAKCRDLAVALRAIADGLDAKAESLEP